MTKKTISQYVIGVLAILVVCIGCASSKKMVFTPGALKNDIGGEQNLSKAQFFLSDDVTVQYTRTKRTPVVKKGTVTVKTDTFKRTFKIKKGTPGILRTRDDDKNPVVGWRMEPSSQPGIEKGVIQLLFWKNSYDNYLEFEASYDESFDDYFEFFSITFSDKKEKVPPISVSLAEGNVVTRETYLDAGGNQVGEPQFVGDIPAIKETFSIDSKTGEKPYLQYNSSEKQKTNAKTKQAPGRKIGK
jgi:hypothetical protein